MRSIVALVALALFPAWACAQSDLALPQIAVGGSPAYETLLQIINEVDAANAVTIDVFQGSLSGSANGQPFPVRFDGGAPVSTYGVTLSRFQEFTVRLTGSETALRNGWVRLRSSTAGGKFSASVIFRQRLGNALEESVGATSAQRYRRAVVLVDGRETGSDTGVALVNTAAAPATVTLDLFQGPDRVVAPVTVTLQPNQHYAQLVSEIFPAFGNRLGTLVIEAPPGIAMPCLALRLDAGHLTSIPVRPLGFVFQYTITGPGGSVAERGLWMFDVLGFNLVGHGKVEIPAAADLPEVTGSWMGTSFQFRYPKSLAGGVGMVVFNGTSAGLESTLDAYNNNKAISGKVTTIDANGQVLSVGDFTAFHRYGPAPQ